MNRTQGCIDNEIIIFSMIGIAALVCVMLYIYYLPVDTVEASELTRTSSVATMESKDGNRHSTMAGSPGAGRINDKDLIKNNEDKNDKLIKIQLLRSCFLSRHNSELFKQFQAHGGETFIFDVGVPFKLIKGEARAEISTVNRLVVEKVDKGKEQGVEEQNDS